MSDRGFIIQSHPCTEVSPGFREEMSRSHSDTLLRLYAPAGRHTEKLRFIALMCLRVFHIYACDYFELVPPAVLWLPHREVTVSIAWVAN